MGRIPFKVLPLSAVPLLLAFSPLTAQTPESSARVGLSSGTPPSMLKGGITGELLAVYTPRSQKDVQERLDSAKSLLKSAESSREEGETRAKSANGQLQIMLEEQQTTKTRLDVAKKEKNSSDVALLTAEAKRQQAERKYLSSLRDTTKADMELLDSQRVAVDAQVKMLQIELDSAKKREELAAGNSENKNGNSDYAALLKKLFSAQKEFADRASEAASKQQKLASRKLKQLDVWSKLPR